MTSLSHSIKIIKTSSSFPPGCYKVHLCILPLEIHSTSSQTASGPSFSCSPAVTLQLLPSLSIQHPKSWPMIWYVLFKTTSQGFVTGFYHYLRFISQIEPYLAPLIERRILAEKELFLPGLIFMKEQRSFSESSSGSPGMMLTHSHVSPRMNAATASSMVEG